MKHIAFIGAGNMGGALVRGACKALDPQEVLIYEPSQKAAAALSAETGCQVAASGAQAVREARYVMLCVKPQVLGPVLEGLLPALREGAQAGEHRVVVSIAAGIQLEALDQMLARGGLELPVVPLLGRVGEQTQHELSAALRRQAAAHSFLLPPENEEKVRGRRVILVDDVVTTGSTAAACAGLLLEAGALEVAVLAAAR